MAELRDIAGNTFGIDDAIVYATRVGNSADLKFARVVRLGDKPRVRGVYQQWNGGWFLQRDAQFPNPNNVLIVSADALPDAVRTLLFATPR